MVGLSVRGMHVEVIAQLQRQGAYRKDKVFEQQIDWRLTSAQNRLVRSKIKPNPQSPLRFEIDQASVSDIQSVLVVDKELRIIKESDIKGYVELPYDFGYLVNDRSNVIEDCKADFTNPTETYASQLRVFKFNETSKATTPFYVTVGVTKQSNTKLINTSGLTSKRDKDWLIESIILLFKEHGYEAYWENFGKVYRANSFIVVVTTLSDTVTMTIDGETRTPDEVIVRNVDRYKVLNGDLASNRCYKQDYVYDAVLQSSYLSPIPTSPVSTIAQNCIHIHTSKKFIVSKIFVDYIRMPRAISLYLNSSCELAPNVHPQVCDIAVELLKRDIEAADYGTKVQDNVIRAQH